MVSDGLMLMGFWHRQRGRVKADLCANEITPLTRRVRYLVSARMNARKVQPRSSGESFGWLVLTGLRSKEAEYIAVANIRIRD